MAGKLEKEIQARCLFILEKYKIFHWRQNSGCVNMHGHFYKMCSISGVSDIIGILPDGRFLAVECKRETGGKVSDVQKSFLNNITQNNGVALVINNPDDLEEKLKELLKPTI